MSIDYQEVEVEVRKGEGGNAMNAMCARRLTLTGRDDLLSPDDAGLDGAASPEEEASAWAGVVDVASGEAAVDGVPSEAAVVFVGAPDEVAPDLATPDAVVAGAEVSIVADASTQ